MRVRVRLADAREGEGIAAELLVPKWFDKSAELSNEQNFEQLRQSVILARRHLIAAGSATAFGLSVAAEGEHRATCLASGLNGLIASFGIALLERAIIDALAELRRTTCVRARAPEPPGTDA